MRRLLCLSGGQRALSPLVGKGADPAGFTGSGSSDLYQPQLLHDALGTHGGIQINKYKNLLQDIFNRFQKGGLKKEKSMTGTTIVDNGELKNVSKL